MVSVLDKDFLIGQEYQLTLGDFCSDFHMWTECKILNNDHHVKLNARGRPALSVVPLICGPGLADLEIVVYPGILVPRIYSSLQNIFKEFSV